MKTGDKTLNALNAGWNYIFHILSSVMLFVNFSNILQPERRALSVSQQSRSNASFYKFVQYEFATLATPLLAICQSQTCQAATASLCCIGNWITMHSHFTVIFSIESRIFTHICWCSWAFMHIIYDALFLFGTGNSAALPMLTLASVFIEYLDIPFRCQD